jgi:Na+/melibiose symporter-like transporter
MFSKLTQNLNLSEKNTFKLHLGYSSIEGVIAGVLALNEFVFIKSMKGSEIQLSVLFQFSVVVYIFLVFFNEFLRNYPNKKQLLKVTAIITRLPLLLLIFFPHDPVSLKQHPEYHYAFLLIILIYYFALPVVSPLINLQLKANYRHENFGKLYGYATSVNKILMLVTTFFYGLMLDVDNFSFRYVFPITGILGMVSIFMLANIPTPTHESFDKKVTFFKSVQNSIRSMRVIVNNNKPYRHFEWGFMFYGFAFMSTITIITIYFDKVLHLNYSSVAFYKNMYNILAILMLPFLGKLLGKIDPRKFAVLTFFSIFLYIFFMMMTTFFRWHISVMGIQIYAMLIGYLLAQSFFSSSMPLLFNIGSAYFCKNEEAGDYQSVHLFLTSVRSFFAPVLGVLFYQVYGFTITFIIGMGFVVIAMGIMIWSYKKDKLATIKNECESY